ncbi:hypothetical protein F4776DRAFT_462124 [Hypoxylon sp. NC0597]|nr:hypothetical protein F4776DRAFT_462124 [Hypoxylon sp. NC0597]
MSHNEGVADLPDEVDPVEDVEEIEVERVDSPVGPVALAWWDIKNVLEGCDYVKHNLRILQSEDGRQVFPKFPDLHDLAWLVINTKVKVSIDAAESFFNQANENGWLCEQVMNPRPGDSVSQENARSGQPPANDVALIRQCQEVTMNLEYVAGLLNQILAGQYRKPVGQMRLQPVVEVPWLGRPARSQLPNPRVDFQQKYPTLLDPAFIPQPGEIQDPHGLLTEWTPLGERYRVILRLSKGIMPKNTTRFRMERGEYSPFVAREHVPLNLVARLPSLPPQNLPRVASLIEEVEALEEKKKASLDAGDRAHYYTIGLMDVGNVPTEDGQPQQPPTKLPSISEVFANDNFMKPGFYNQPLQPSRHATKRDFDNYVIERGYKATEPHLAKTMSHSDPRFVAMHNYATGQAEVSEYFADHNRGFSVAQFWHLDQPPVAPPPRTRTRTGQASSSLSLSSFPPRAAGTSAKGKQKATSNRVYKPMEKGESSGSGPS